jgi:two-component system OmpR family sensor kinase
VSLRLKLLIAVIVVAFGGLAASDVATYTSLRSFLFERVDRQLEDARFSVLHDLQEGGGFAVRGGPGSPLEPPGTYAELRDTSGNLIGQPLRKTYGAAPSADPSLPSKLPRPGVSADQPDRFTVGAIGGGSLRYRVRVDPVQNPRGDKGMLLVAVPLADVDQTLGRLRLIEGLVSAFVVLALGFLLWWLVRRELRPLEEIGVTAGAIAAGDLTRRVQPTDERTEIGRLGIALNSMLAQIEAAFEERRASESRLRRFVADASHELRTPLTSIRGYAELFRRGASARPQDLEKSMRRIEAEASRMGVMVDDLLLLARLDQGRPLDRASVDLGQVAMDAAESARAVEPDRPIDVQVEGPAIVDGDAGKLRQVVDNLLDNVRVHTPAGTPVHVRVEGSGQEVVLSVADEGPGLSPEAVGRVFERFYRGDPARSRVTGGAGLGLSIVFAIAEAHGGRVGASSADGSGAAFEVRLPARSDAEVELQPEGEGESEVEVPADPAGPDVGGPDEPGDTAEAISQVGVLPAGPSEPPAASPSAGQPP